MVVKRIGFDPVGVFLGADDLQCRKVLKKKASSGSARIPATAFKQRSCYVNSLSKHPLFTGRSQESPREAIQ